MHVWIDACRHGDRNGEEGSWHGDGRVIDQVPNHWLVLVLFFPALLYLLNADAGRYRA
jgi:hypothetical protein